MPKAYSNYLEVAKIISSRHTNDKTQKASSTPGALVMKNRAHSLADTMKNVNDGSRIDKIMSAGPRVTGSTKLGSGHFNLTPMGGCVPPGIVLY